MGKPFTLITDHTSLVTLLQSSEGMGTRPLHFARWSARLLRYTFKVVYRRSSQNVVADSLSRLLVSEPESNKSINAEAAICIILSIPLTILPEQLSKETIADPVLKKVIGGLRRKTFQRNFYHTFMFGVIFVFGVISA